MSREAARVMQAQGTGGDLVYIASKNGVVAGPANIAYGVEPHRLGEYYASRTLLGREVLPEHVADAVAVLVEGSLSRTTGLVIPVDGGLPAAFLR